MRINTNITAIISNNSLQRAENRLSSSIERLSSGYKLNSSADDPAGCAITEKMRMQLRGLEQADNNVADGISVINTAEGAMIEIQSMLARMKELTVQAANDVNSDDERAAIQAELDNINSEIDRISKQTEFNTQSLIDGNLSRRVYSDFQGVNQLECSDSFVAGEYGITVLEDARQAITVGSGTITMNNTDVITKEQAGSIEINGYEINIEEGDTLDAIMGKLVDASNMLGGKAFVVDSLDNDTAANGTEYAGYQPSTTYSGNTLVFMTNQYGSRQELKIECDNAQLAGMLGISQAATEEGITAHGVDVKAEFTIDNGNRVGFEDSAILSTEGTKITIKDVNNKTFKLDVPGNSAGTQFDDSATASTATATNPREITQEVTDVGTMSVHIGANENQVIIVDIPEVTTYTLGTEHINVMTGITAQQSIDIVDSAVAYANEVRSKLGAYQNRFEHTQANLSVSSENVTASISTMMDTDMAEEMTEYTSLNVLVQASTSILAQANERPSTVLQLLQ